MACSGMRQTGAVLTLVVLQFLQLNKRNYMQYWRNVPYNGTRFIFGIVIALIMGCILWDVGGKR